jgi:hypothetical protein
MARSQNEEDGDNRPGRPPGRHRAYETDSNGERIWTRWGDCGPPTCDRDGDHDQ